MRKTGSPVLNRDELLKDIDIELVETSGPVSPKYHYTTSVHLYSDGCAVFLDYHDSRKDPERTSVHFLKELKAAELKRIVRKLGSLVFVKSNAGRDFVGGARSRIGVSFNWLSIQIGSEVDLRVDYLLSDFEYEGFDDYAKAINLLKSLVTLNPNSSCPRI